MCFSLSSDCVSATSSGSFFTAYFVLLSCCFSTLSSELRVYIYNYWYFVIVLILKILFSDMPYCTVCRFLILVERSEVSSCCKIYIFNPVDLVETYPLHLTTALPFSSFLQLFNSAPQSWHPRPIIYHSGSSHEKMAFNYLFSVCVMGNLGPRPCRHLQEDLNGW